MKQFNTTGPCIPEKHYMVDLSSRLAQIKAMVDDGQYFNIHRPRQYGKTTILAALAKSLRADYAILRLDFGVISSAAFQTEISFVRAFSHLLLLETENIPETIAAQLHGYAERQEGPASLTELFHTLWEWCQISAKPIVLIVDNVDASTDSQVFFSFLTKLRAGHIARASNDAPAFQSVILASVIDLMCLELILNTKDFCYIPWNIAADFNIAMSFNADELADILREYEADHHTGMDIPAVAQEIYAYTSGHPFLVSRLCALLNAESAPWTAESISKAVQTILTEDHPAFASVLALVQGNSNLREALRQIVLEGSAIPYTPYNPSIAEATMHGLVERDNGKARIANRIFEALLRRVFQVQKRKECLP